MLMNTPNLNKEIIPELMERHQVSDEAVMQADTAAMQEDANVSNDDEGFSKEVLVVKLKELLQKEDEHDLKAQVESLKRLYYKNPAESRHIDEVQDASFDASIVALDIEFKALLSAYKEKKAKQLAELERLRAKNLEKRKAILDQINAFLAHPESVHEHVTEFKKLQQAWREVGEVSAAAYGPLFKSYALSVENFYDLLKMNIELRDYDFKKNLELKTAFCEAAEKLADATDVLNAFRSLQQMHREWSDIGPVEKDLRESLWLRFKEASAVINKKYQAFFETQKAQEQENLEQKAQICASIESFDCDLLKSFKDWEDKTEALISLQKEWKTIGFAPRKNNVKVYERYRAACDDFFTKKNAFYKTIKESLQENYEKKKALVEKAEALKESTEWKETTMQLIDIQKEWKAIGSVPRKQSDYIWKRFIAACDYFFEQKEKSGASQKTEEQENLSKKQALINEISAFKRSDDLSDSVAALKALVNKWNDIGHVPFKEKDVVYKAFRAVCDKQFDALNVDAHKRHIDTFTVSLDSVRGKDKNMLFRERDHLLKQFERLKSELLTCENNIGFFNPNSKKPNPMIEMMQQKIDKLKKEKDLLLEKIQLIEAQLA